MFEEFKYKIGEMSPEAIRIAYKTDIHELLRKAVILENIVKNNTDLPKEEIHRLASEAEDLRTEIYNLEVELEVALL